MSSTTPTSDSKPSIDWGQLERDVNDTARAAKNEVDAYVTSATLVTAFGSGLACDKSAQLSARSVTNNKESIEDAESAGAACGIGSAALSVGAPGIASIKAADASIDAGAASAQGSIRIFKA